MCRQNSCDETDQDGTLCNTESDELHDQRAGESGIFVGLQGSGTWKGRGKGAGRSRSIPFRWCFSLEVRAALLNQSKFDFILNVFLQIDHCTERIENPSDRRCDYTEKYSNFC